MEIKSKPPGVVDSLWTKEETVRRSGTRTARGVSGKATAHGPRVRPAFEAQLQTRPAICTFATYLPTSIHPYTHTGTHIHTLKRKRLYRATVTSVSSSSAATRAAERTILGPEAAFVGGHHKKSTQLDDDQTRSHVCNVAAMV